MSQDVIKLLIDACLETLYMVSVSSVIASLAGSPLGVLLTITGRGHIKENLWLNQTVGSIINAFRSTPFIILMVAIIPVTRLLVGTSIGTTAAIVPLTITAIPFIARIIESALKEVDGGVIEAAQSMGATPLEIIRKVLLPEAMPSIVLGLTLTVVNLIGHSAMAGALGGGGLGDLAIRYGYQRFRLDIMIATVVVLIVQVQLVQTIGDKLSARLNKNKL